MPIASMLRWGRAPEGGMGTDRIQSVSNLLSRVVALLVVLLVAAGVAWWTLGPDHGGRAGRLREAPIPDPVDWAGVDRAVVQSLDAARAAAAAQARAELQAWTDELMTRVDEDFLDWYFSYWNQNVLGMKSLWFRTVQVIHSEAPDAASRITAEIQAEFATRVLRPPVAQLELERISRRALETYLVTLREHVRDIPTRYDVPLADWSRYLDDLALVSSQVDGSREVPLTLKTVVTASAAGVALTAQRLGPMAGRIGARLSGRLAGSTVARTATATGVKVAGQVGGKLLGPIVGIGVVAWDLWDHHSTQARERPVLRRNIADYFAEMVEMLLADEQAGVLAPVGQMERAASSALRARRAVSVGMPLEPDDATS